MILAPARKNARWAATMASGSLLSASADHKGVAAIGVLQISSSVDPYKIRL